ncbi:hypothetical protein KsCSTR_06180 [Candidatus Kuenenia stuttgartiensis]|uniref:Uncharacterized protein n=1 Tax=Kuenenia stuttgartiensis TaxID=174633 RepID=Q1PZW9_KUEST|nr:hypothetical protein KsCSTR_06180 [Candidatus Kuenenia stuttgartiensis]CAJ72625.1 unknown protein [Candidatus Kuenenia stuttgartiensis]
MNLWIFDVLTNSGVPIELSKLRGCHPKTGRTLKGLCSDMWLQMFSLACYIQVV